MDSMVIDLFSAISERIVQLHQPRMHWAVFEVDRYRLKDIGTKFFPCLCFGEDAMSERSRAIATLLRVANFED
jgi:hypothetical protein